MEEAVNKRTINLLCVLGLAACGGGEDAATPTSANPGFEPPTAVTTAFTEEAGVFTEVGPADWSCLNTPSQEQPAASAIEISGQVTDFQTGEDVAEADISVFGDVKDIGGAGQDAGISAADGTFTVQMPEGTGRVAFKVMARGALDTYSVNQATDGLVDINSVSQLTANALPAFIGVSRTPGLGVLAGAIRDCNGHEVRGAVATVSNLSGSAEHLDGAATYYFSADASDSLPVRHRVQGATNKDGLFTVIEVVPTDTAFLQVWGFTSEQNPATDDMTILAEIPSPIFADSVVISSLEPMRSN